MTTETQAPDPGADDMLEPLIYAAIMHNGKPKTVAEFERAAANVADMLQRRAEVTHNKPVASIYISDDGSREFDDWRVDLPPGNHQLFTAPRPDQPQPESLPHPGAPEAEEMIEKLLAECNRPSNMKNAALAGYMAAKRLLQNARQPLPAVEDAEPIGWGGVIETCAELCDPHFIAQQDLAELKRYAGNWNSTYRFFPIYAPNTQCAEGALHAFKNFHQRLCERFGYFHDEQDWQRDLCSLEEHIAALAGPAPQAPDMVSVPLTVLEDASSSLGHYLSDRGWSDEDMQAMDNLDAYIARHKANAAAKQTKEPTNDR